MQAFESKDRVAAQVQQHADSYSRILACNLLAAGHQPPEWLLPSATLPQGASQLLPLPPLLSRLRAGDSGGFLSGGGVDCVARLGLISIRTWACVAPLVGLVDSADLSLGCPIEGCS